MAANIRTIHLDHPSTRLLSEAAAILDGGGIVIYPTDTIYGIGVDLFNKSAIERVLRIKKASNHKLLSFICQDLKEVSRWARIPDQAYPIMRRVLPGPYTFILRASREIPKIMLQKRKTVGIRIPDSAIPHALAAELGRPILSASVPLGSDGYYTDPHEIAETYNHDIDLILDAGVMFNSPSTVVDFSGPDPQIIREGSGDVDALYF